MKCWPYYLAPIGLLAMGLALNYTMSPDLFGVFYSYLLWYLVAFSVLIWATKLSTRSCAVIAAGIATTVLLLLAIQVVSSIEGKGGVGWGTTYSPPRWLMAGDYLAEWVSETGERSRERRLQSTTPDPCANDIDTLLRSGKFHHDLLAFAVQDDNGLLFLSKLNSAARKNGIKLSRFKENGELDVTFPSHKLCFPAYHISLTPKGEVLLYTHHLGGSNPAYLFDTGGKLLQEIAPVEPLEFITPLRIGLGGSVFGVRRTIPPEDLMSPKPRFRYELLEVPIAHQAVPRVVRDLTTLLRTESGLEKKVKDLFLGKDGAWNLLIETSPDNLDARLEDYRGVLVKLRDASHPPITTSLPNHDLQYFGAMSDGTFLLSSSDDQRTFLLVKDGKFEFFEAGSAHRHASQDPESQEATIFEGYAGESIYNVYAVVAPRDQIALLTTALRKEASSSPTEGAQVCVVDLRFLARDGTVIRHAALPSFLKCKGTESASEKLTSGCGGR